MDPPTDVSDISSQYNRELSKILDKHALLKSKTILERSNSEWFNDEMGDLKHALRKLECKYKQSGLAIDKNIYDLKCSEYDKARNITETHYYTNKVNDCLNDQGSIFSIMNKLLQHSKSSPLPAYSDPAILANEFAEFFDSKILKIHNV